MESMWYGWEISENSYWKDCADSDRTIIPLLASRGSRQGYYDMILKILYGLLQNLKSFSAGASVCRTNAFVGNSAGVFISFKDR